MARTARLPARRPWSGHGGTVRSVPIGDRRVLVLLGRTHHYEGLGVGPVVHGVRTAAAAGCRAVLLTNAAGGLREGMSVGQPVLISDHLNLTARSPLVGAEVRGPDRPVLGRGCAAVARDDRPVADGGRVRGAARPALRDAGRDPDAAHDGRRPGRHVDGAGGDRGAGGRRRGVRAVAGDQPGGRDHRRAAEPQGSAGRRAGRGAAGWARCWPNWWQGHDAHCPTDAARTRRSAGSPTTSTRRAGRVAGRAGQGDGRRPEAVDDLADRMAGPLAFGTAGLRGPVRAGRTA